ncbi:MAG: hypothetical protein HBSAPP02_04520 [Phycisphaerae bacterium]|nr:MAG: hypothetical protein HBSAPP02_04520 [Phycisphaerae bacterium]
MHHNDRRDPSSTVPLTGLSASQRSLVERHSPLVHLTLKRTFGTRPDFPPERADMVQEGYLALAEAIRSHDPARHGVFASYAMARIHFAMSRYRHESGPLIRVPFVTQRRRRDASRRAADNALDPAKGVVRLDSSTDDALPRVVPLNFHDGAPHPIHRRETIRATPHANGEFLTIGDLIRQRIELALERAVAMESQRPRRSIADRALIRRCAAERLGVPNEASRTPLRRLAQELGCPLARVTRCEAALGRAAARLLEHDAAFQALLRIGREADEGWRASAERITIEKPPPAQSAPGGDGEPARQQPAPRPPAR